MSQMFQSARENPPKPATFYLKARQTNRVVGSCTRQRSGAPDAQQGATRRWNPASDAQMLTTCHPFEKRASISNGYLQTVGRSQVSTGRVRYSPDSYAKRVAKTQGHRTQTTRRSPASDAVSASAVNHRTHITGLTQDTMHVTGEFTPTGATHRTHRARPVQCPMLRPVSPKDNILLP